MVITIALIVVVLLLDWIQRAPEISRIQSHLAAE